MKSKIPIAKYHVSYQKTWMLDASSVRANGVACFVPYCDGDLIVGMNVISHECPGALVGLFHPCGQKAAEEWAEENKDWHEKYRSKDDK